MYSTQCYNDCLVKCAGIPVVCECDIETIQLKEEILNEQFIKSFMKQQN